MVRADVREFIRCHGLLHGVGSECGVYAVTIDGYVAYIDTSKNMLKTCFGHIARTVNKTPLSRRFYRILFDAWINKHVVDCKVLEVCPEDALAEKKKEALLKFDPPLAGVAHDERKLPAVWIGVDGTAAGDTVKKLVTAFIDPLVQLIVGSQEGLQVASFTVEVAGRKGEFMYGAFISSLITLVAVALVVYGIIHLLKLDKLDKKAE